MHSTFNRPLFLSHSLGFFCAAVSIPRPVLPRHLQAERRRTLARACTSSHHPERSDDIASGVTRSPDRKHLWLLRSIPIGRAKASTRFEKARMQAIEQASPLALIWCHCAWRCLKWCIFNDNF